MTENDRSSRNLDPHDAARAAMWLFGSQYSKQAGGSMDFWDSLSAFDKEMCREMVREIRCARPELR